MLCKRAMTSCRREVRRTRHGGKAAVEAGTEVGEGRVWMKEIQTGTTAMVIWDPLERDLWGWEEQLGLKKSRAYSQRRRKSVSR